ncbi:hypothetical protein [Pelagibius sp. Alg239-R121]|uniref:hypothetical protein n=1 Tax=Pelagibius sp. Alg239-R121 TaxID=2993448 RepID=UPI0024A6AECA|nr:hypothetical protein [Pelagibius sp. Alg239-R121]
MSEEKKTNTVAVEGTGKEKAAEETPVNHNRKMLGLIGIVGAILFVALTFAGFGRWQDREGREAKAKIQVEQATLQDKAVTQDAFKKKVVNQRRIEERRVDKTPRRASENKLSDFELAEIEEARKALRKPMQIWTVEQEKAGEKVHQASLGGPASSVSALPDSATKQSVEIRRQLMLRLKELQDDADKLQRQQKQSPGDAQ